jgi:acyl-CoA dehydrogenase
LYVTSSLLSLSCLLFYINYSLPLCSTPLFQGRSLFCAEAINSNAPDTGNMEIIAKFGTTKQRERWLLPLLEGEIKSCFGMTEPKVASSDPTQLHATAVLVPVKDKAAAASSSSLSLGSLWGRVTGADSNTESTGKAPTADQKRNVWVINGRKWWTTGACDPRCKICIFVALTDNGDPSVPVPAHRRHSFFLVPMDSAGITVVRPLTVFGYEDAPHGHAEVLFENVIVPASASGSSDFAGLLNNNTTDAGEDINRNRQIVLPTLGSSNSPLSAEDFEAGGLIGLPGRGFDLAQARLGPGRLHHCCRLVGTFSSSSTFLIRFRCCIECNQ